VFGPRGRVEAAGPQAVDVTGMLLASEAIVLRDLRRGEESRACSLARQVFSETVAPGLPGDGIEEFHRYAEPLAFAARLASHHAALVATRRNKLVGLIEIRHKRHIAMLFVAQSHRGRGVGSRLLERALTLCDPGPVTVHAAPDAFAFYARHGFTATAPEQLVNGLRFVPMSRERQRTSRASGDVPPNRSFQRKRRAGR